MHACWVDTKSNPQIPLAAQSNGSDGLSGCIRQCDWDRSNVCRSCGTITRRQKTPPFPSCLSVDDLEKAKQFYVNVLGCNRSRKMSRVSSVFGHQISHVVPQMPELSTSPVDGKEVPSMHFGIVMEWDDWHQLKDKPIKAVLNSPSAHTPDMRINQAPKQPCSSSTHAATTLNSNRSKMRVPSLTPNGNYSSSEVDVLGLFIRSSISAS